MAEKISSSELGIDLQKGETDIFKWFLASFLMGKRIQSQVAAKTFHVFMDYGLTSPAAISKKSWRELVRMLGEGHYVRYDETTATRLLEMSDAINKEYGGKFTNIYKESASRKDLEKKLQTFRGVGPKTVDIFMRDMSNIWKF